MLVEPRELLIHVLREQLRLTGSHIGCETSHCGACTVDFNGQSLKSCTMLAVQAQGANVITVEGLAPGGELHPIQRRARKHGVGTGEWRRRFQPGDCLGGSKYMRVAPARRGRGNKSKAPGTGHTPTESHAAMTWAQRLKRVFDIDIQTRSQCGGAVEVIVCIQDPVVIEKILTHLNTPTLQVPLPNSRAPPQSTLFN